MKKLLLVLMAFATITNISAQVYTEYFENATSGTNLEDLDNWFVTQKIGYDLGTSPIFSDQAPLTYTNYAGSDKGLSVKIDSLTGWNENYRLTNGWIHEDGDSLKLTGTDTMYAAFLVKPYASASNDTAASDYRDVFSYELSYSMGNWSRGRAFIKIYNDTDVQFGVGKRNMPIGAGDTAMRFFNGIEDTYLIVLTYIQIEGDLNDIIKLYINPDPTKSMTEQINILTAADTINQDYYDGKPMRMNIVQRGHTAEIGCIRVGKNWKEVVDGSNEKNHYNTLSELRVDGSFVNGFSPLTFTYNVGVKPGTIVLPVVTASPTFSKATVDIANATTIPGTATVEVIAENGDKQTYTLNFSTDYYTSNLVNEIDKTIIYHSNGVIKVKCDEKLTGSTLEVYDITGRLLHSGQITSNNEQVYLNTKGMFIVRIVNAENKLIHNSKIVLN